MSSIKVTVVILFLIGSWAALGKSKSADSGVLSRLHHGNQFEIAISELVCSRSESDDLKAFAIMIVQDHTIADTRVLALADTLKVEIVELSRTPEEDALVAQLRGLAGKEFDLLFLNNNIDRHAATMSFLESMRKDVSVEVGTFIDELLLTLHKHHDRAIVLRQQLDGNSHFQWFQIPWGCRDWAFCTMQVGPFGSARAHIRGRMFHARDWRYQSTCCQLSAKIHRQVCNHRLPSRGLWVQCR